MTILTLRVTGRAIIAQDRSVPDRGNAPGQRRRRATRQESVERMNKPEGGSVLHAGLLPHGFLVPDLCAPRSVLFLLLVGALLALTLVLFDSGLAAFDWVVLGRASVFILWNMLAGAASLCLLRARIARLPLAAGAALSFSLLLAICGVSSWGSQQLLHLFLQQGKGFDPVQFQRDLLIAALLGGAALRYFHLQGQLLRQQRAELSARIESLQARIRPHFLFNSMNIIASLIAVDPEQAERAVEDLSELFRASLREGRNTVPIGEELDLCRRYLRLEQLRLGERLRVEQHVARLPGTVRLPSLSIQPLLENAVYHGVQPLPEGGCIVLGVRLEGRDLLVEIVNPVAPGEHQPGQGAGMALANIRDRLAAIYGDAASLVTRAEAGRFRAELRIPADIR
jgi:two-component system, LytTR family, sensor histidine kinase AlgZ